MDDKNDVNKIEILHPSEAVRRRPRMYFEECFNENRLDMLPVEVACHAADEIIDGQCTSLVISVFPAHFEVTYDAGMRLDPYQDGEALTVAEILMTHLFACKNLKKHLHVGGHLCRFGMAAVNFASEWFHVKTVSMGRQGLFKFYQGRTELRKVTEISGTDMTKLSFKPDPAIFGDMWFTYDGVASKAKELSSQLDGFPVNVVHGGYAKPITLP